MTDVIFDASDSNVADTSRQTYKELAESGELGEQAEQLAEALKAMPYFPTINELSMGPLAGWEKSTISGRLGTLRDHDLIEMMGKRPDKFNDRKAKTWALKEEIE